MVRCSLAFASFLFMTMFSGCRHNDNEETVVNNSTTIVVIDHCRNDNHAQGQCCGHHDGKDDKKGEKCKKHRDCKDKKCKKS